MYLNTRETAEIAAALPGRRYEDAAAVALPNNTRRERARFLECFFGTTVRGLDHADILRLFSRVSAQSEVEQRGHLDFGGRRPAVLSSRAVIAWEARRRGNDFVHVVSGLAPSRSTDLDDTLDC